MSTTNTPCICPLAIENLNFRVVERLKYQYFILFRFKIVKINFNVYIHNIFAEKLLSSVIYSAEKESLLITSPNISSTLN